MTAVVADELRTVFVVAERHVAMGTAGRPTALGALQIGGETASVLEQHHLLAPRKGLLDFVDQEFIEVAVSLTALGGSARIREVDFRQLGLAVTLRQRGVAILTGGGIKPRFERGGGTTQQGASAPLMRHPDRHIACRIAWCRIGLLIACVVLLIDNDELQTLQRQED